MISTRNKGMEYEERAAKILEAKGFRILEKNVHYRWGEIDLIAVDSPCSELVFVEVRYRSESSWVDPLESISGRKQNRLRRAIQTYLSKHSRSETHYKGIRIDLVVFRGDRVEHIENAI